MENEMEGVATMTIHSSSAANESWAKENKVWRGEGEEEFTPYARMYNPQTLESITGEVVSVERITPLRVLSYGVQLLIQTETEMLPIHLGMGWFIENQDLNIAPRDTIEITGSRITFDDQPAIIAAEVRKDNAVLTLRDTSGFPVWTGWRCSEHS